MMKTLTFLGLSGLELSERLIEPILGISILDLPHGRSERVTLWYEENLGLEISSQMQDVGERAEIGVLQFREHVGRMPTSGVWKLPFAKVFSVQKMIIEEAGVRAESGICLMGRAEKEKMIIVAGAQPYTLALNFLDMPHACEPEYDLDRYEFVPLT